MTKKEKSVFLAVMLFDMELLSTSLFSQYISFKTVIVKAKKQLIK